MPRALIDSFRFGLMGLAATSYRDYRKAKLDRWRRDITFNTDGAMNHSLGFLIMVHDNSDGELVLRKNGSAKIDWPGAPTELVYKDVDSVMRPAVEAIGGTYIKNPRWDKRFLGKHLITAHPMGGCATADNVDAGVVDHAGRVFQPTSSTYDRALCLRRIGHPARDRGKSVSDHLYVRRTDRRTAARRPWPARLRPQHRGRRPGISSGAGAGRRQRHPAGNPHVAAFSAQREEADHLVAVPWQPEENLAEIRARHHLDQLVADAPDDEIGVLFFTSE